MRRRSLALIIAAALSLTVLLIWAFAPAPLTVEAAPVTRGPFLQTIDEDGVTRVRDRYIVTAPVSGTLLRPRVEAGDEIKRDDVVATIIPSTPELLDPRTRSELLARQEAADARASRARTLVKQAEAALGQAEIDLKRLRELARGNYVSKTQLDQAELTVEIRKKDLEAAHFEADAARHDLEQTRAALARLADARRTGTDEAGAWEIRAPASGRILRVVSESGGPITVGDTIFEIGDVTRMEAVIDVLSNEATRISPGAGVELTAGDGIVMYGQVRMVEPAARTKISALGVEEQRVDVIVDLIPDRRVIRHVGDGYRVEARIIVARDEDAVQVPVAALFRQGTQWAVFAVERDRAVTRTVELGPRNTESAVVRKGLETGTLVILYPGDSLEDGRRVEMRPRARAGTSASTGQTYSHSERASYPSDGRAPPIFALAPAGVRVSSERARRTWRSASRR